MTLTHFETTPQLYFHLVAPERNRHIISVPSLLQTNRWCHIAAVTGRGGMKLYLNGHLIGSDPFTGSFAAIQRYDEAYLGHSAWHLLPADEDFHGQMDEMRVWKVALTEAQIRETMFQRLTGAESDLAALWNFDNVENGVVKDSGPRGYHGKLVGNAEAVPTELPQSLTSGTGVRTRRVLDLNGRDACVELPPKLFTNDVVTVEGWFKWRTFGDSSRIFEFYDSRLQFGIQNRYVTGTLHYERPERSAGGAITHYAHVQAPGLLVPNEWCHVAVVAGTNSARLYFNGSLVQTNEIRYDWRPNGEPEHRNYLGRTVMHSVGVPSPDFDGQMTEVRLWAGERTADQIRANLSSELTGKESGLLALWNFADGTANDASSAGHHGKLIGQARIVETILPAREGVLSVVSIHGTVTDIGGQALGNVVVTLVQNDAVIASATSDNSGHYRLAPVLVGEPGDLSASRGDLGTWVTGVPLRGDDRQEINLRLAYAGAISGTLFALDDSSHVATVVEAVRASGTRTNQLAGARVVATTRSDTRGAYRFVNLRPGAYQIRCTTSGGYVYYAEGKAVEFQTGRSIANIDLRFPPFKRGRWDTYNVAAGLASDLEIRKILFEPNGVTWFATRGGISRFDGNEFVNFTTEDGLADDYVGNIARQPDGTLWFTTGKGVSRYDGKKFVNFDEKDGLPAGFLDAAYVTTKGVLWVGGNSGLARHDGNRFTTFTATNGLPGGGVKKICGSPDGKTLWLASNGGLVRYDGSSFVNVTTQAGIEMGTDTAHVAPDGKVWFGSGRGAWRYDGTNFVNYTTRDGLAHDDVLCTYSTPDGLVWFATQGGISRFDGTNFINFTSEDGLPANHCIFVTSSPDGVMWFGSSTAGAARYDAKTFTSFTMADGLADNFGFTSAAATDGTLWFGHAIGSGRSTGASHYDGNKWTRFSETNGLSSQVSQIARATDGTLWFGTVDGVIRFDGNSSANSRQLTACWTIT
jgi:hypothetical protein